MTTEQMAGLDNGLYECIWKDPVTGEADGSSLVVLGCLHNGERWMACANWISDAEERECWQAALVTQAFANILRLVPIRTKTSQQEAEEYVHLTWYLKTGERHLSLTTLADAEVFVKEWADWSRGDAPHRLVNGDHLIGGKGWAFDLEQLVGLSSTPVPPLKQQSKPKEELCWPCVALGCVFLTTTFALGVLVGHLWR